MKRHRPWQRTKNTMLVSGPEVPTWMGRCGLPACRVRRGEGGQGRGLFPTPSLTKISCHSAGETIAANIYWMLSGQAWSRKLSHTLSHLLLLVPGDQREEAQTLKDCPRSHGQERAGQSERALSQRTASDFCKMMNNSVRPLRILSCPLLTASGLSMSISMSKWPVRAPPVCLCSLC